MASGQWSIHVNCSNDGIWQWNGRHLNNTEYITNVYRDFSQPYSQLFRLPPRDFPQQHLSFVFLVRKLWIFLNITPPLTFPLFRFNRIYKRKRTHTHSHRSGWLTAAWSSQFGAIYRYQHEGLFTCFSYFFCLLVEFYKKSSLILCFICVFFFFLLIFVGGATKNKKQLFCFISC